MSGTEYIDQVTMSLIVRSNVNAMNFERRAIHDAKRDIWGGRIVGSKVKVK